MLISICILRSCIGEDITSVPGTHRAAYASLHPGCRRCWADISPSVVGRGLAATGKRENSDASGHLRKLLEGLRF